MKDLYQKFLRSPGLMNVDDIRRVKAGLEKLLSDYSCYLEASWCVGGLSLPEQAKVGLYNELKAGIENADWYLDFKESRGE